MVMKIDVNNILVAKGRLTNNQPINLEISVTKELSIQNKTRRCANIK